MTRYFYRCPIAAAWQLKSHNILCQVNFTHYNGDYYLPCDEETILDIMKRGNPKFYVSEDSLPLLQPMVGDCGEDVDGNLCRFDGKSWVIHRTKNEWGDCTIHMATEPVTMFKRNNLAWIAPEVEE